MAFIDHNGQVFGLEWDEIFVFGSNKAGRHGKGAARLAMRWGAVYGKAEGIMGRTYAIPIKDENLQTLSYDEILQSLRLLAKVANSMQDRTFLLTAIGTGLAGLSEKRMQKIVEGTMLPRNVVPWWTFKHYARLEANPLKSR
jgi:hypothetical protein